MCPKEGHEITLTPAEAGEWLLCLSLARGGSLTGNVDHLPSDLRRALLKTYGESYRFWELHRPLSERIQAVRQRLNTHFETDKLPDLTVSDHKIREGLDELTRSPGRELAVLTPASLQKILQALGSDDYSQLLAQTRHPDNRRKLLQILAHRKDWNPHSHSS